jgi:LacI family transcriptional regulator
MFSNRANTVAFIYPPYESMHDALDMGRMDHNLGSCIAGAEGFLSEKSVYVTLTSTTGKFLNQKEYLKIIRSKMVDGVLIWGWTEKDEFLYELLEEKVPAVMLQTEAPKADISKVVADDYNGMKAIVEYVIEMGHRNIAIAKPSQSSSAGVMRFKGMIEVMKAHGLEPCYISKNSGFGPEFGYLAGKEILSRNTGATCIMAPNDTSALGIIEAAKELKISIPDDISLTGADGVKFLGQTQLTTYISPSFEIGHKGAELLSKLVEEPNTAPEKICLPVTFIKGETVKQV